MQPRAIRAHAVLLTCTHGICNDNGTLNIRQLPCRAVIIFVIFLMNAQLGQYTKYVIYCQPHYT